MSDRAAGRAATAPAAVWGGQELLDALTAATECLAANRDRVNALNVFPVPDGDTGTNMGLTMRAAIDEVRNAGDDARATAGAAGAKIAYGALMGARGNSGVILSQIFRGFAAAISDREEIDGRDLARALSAAQEMAYKAVMRPVEGTMLTVIRGAAERAEAVASRTPALPTVLGEAVHGARAALATTPDLLDILRQAGVVDAGGQGVVHILEGMERYARGEPIVSEPTVAAGALGAEMVFLDQIEELHGEDAFGYCTNFMVFGTAIDFERVRADIAAMGQSAVIVGDETILKVHIHVLNPGHVLDYAVRLGELGQIKIDNMNAQTQTLSEQRQRALPPPAAPPAPAPHDTTAPPVPLGGKAILAVAAGKGLADALRSMGATGIITGGQTMNPSTQELLSAVEAAPTEEVILLPNNPNILLAANQVPALTTKRVRVVATRSVPQGLAALTAYNADADLDTNAKRMEASRAAVRTVELTCAVRNAEINGINVGKGQIIGLVDDELIAAGDEELAVVEQALHCAGIEVAELVTVFTGDGADASQTSSLRAALERLNDEAEIEVYEGGQPHYRYIIAVE